jgi:hypothetical protein
MGLIVRRQLARKPGECEKSLTKIRAACFKRVPLPTDSAGANAMEDSAKDVNGKTILLKASVMGNDFLKVLKTRPH